MTAITTAKFRTTNKTKSGTVIKRKMAVAKVVAGAIAVTNAAGYATNGTATTGLTCLGIAEETVDNTGGSVGDKTIQIRTGEAWVTNSGINPVTQAHVDSLCYIEDNDTVGSLSTGMSSAGYVKAVDMTLGVLVCFGVSTVKS